MAEDANQAAVATAMRWPARDAVTCSVSECSGVFKERTDERCDAMMRIAVMWRTTGDGMTDGDRDVLRRVCRGLGGSGDLSPTPENMSLPLMTRKNGRIETRETVGENGKRGGEREKRKTVEKKGKKRERGKIVKKGSEGCGHVSGRYQVKKKVRFEDDVVEPSSNNEKY
ncbi:hypothetical protein Scep_013030 [Stephania cephalantha]|uniref:Uncharacterized protein n=1 Tax=Stephania cephalantha TaxID=152367 RepID=A0AAP0JIH6_9MAGN